MLPLSVICKDLVSCVRKTSLGCIFLKMPISVGLIFSDENDIANLVVCEEIVPAYCVN